MDSAVDTEVLPRSVSGFGHLRVSAWLAAHRSFTQPSHVLHRLSTPEHPPITLSNLTTFTTENLRSRDTSLDYLVIVTCYHIQLVKDHFSPSRCHSAERTRRESCTGRPGTEWTHQSMRALRAGERSPPTMVEATGLEPATSCLQSRGSTN